MKKFWMDEGGAVAVEYAVLVGVIALGIILAAGYFRDSLVQWFTNAGDTVEATVPPIASEN